jgi:hypothetical protein
MRRIGRELVARWEQSLSDVVELDLGDDAGAATAALDAAVRRREQRNLAPRGPLAVFQTYRDVTDELDRFLATQDPADPAVARARSIGAHADFAVAGRALDLALIADGTPRPGRPRPQDAFDSTEIAALAVALHGAHDIRGGATELVPWTSSLHRDLAVVTDSAAHALVRLDASVLGDQVADGVGSSLSTLLDDDVLGKLIHASSHAITFLHRTALELTHAAVRKTAGFCDEDVQHALAAWFTRGTSDEPTAVVATVSGLDAAQASWELWASSGVDVAAQLEAVAASRGEHLQHLCWADRAVDVAAMVYATTLAAPPTVPFAVFFGGIALVGLAAWMLWAAGDHCREVADLV